MKTLERFANILGLVIVAAVGITALTSLVIEVCKLVYGIINGTL